MVERKEDIDILIFKESNLDVTIAKEDLDSSQRHLLFHANSKGEMDRYNSPHANQTN
jgi:hypothetical protein